jgi:hypothetical protein
MCLTYNRSAPIQIVQVIQQSVSIGSDTKHPLAHGSSDDGVIATLAQAVHDLRIYSVNTKRD